MSIQILALIVVVAAFTLLFAWTFWPGNRERFENHGKLILDNDDIKTSREEGENS